MRTNPKIEKYNVLEYENSMTQNRSLYRVRYLSVPLYKSKYTEEDIYTKEERNFRKLLKQANQNSKTQYIPIETVKGESPNHSPISYEETKPQIPEPIEKPTLLNISEKTPDITQEEATLLGTRREKPENVIKTATLLEPQESELKIPKPKITPKQHSPVKKPARMEVSPEETPPVESKRKRKKKLSAAEVKKTMEAERINSLINQDGYYNTILPKDHNVPKNEPVTTKAFYIKIGLLGVGVITVICAMIYYIVYYL